MKIPILASLMASLALLLSGAGVQAQGTFQNLNFESPILPLIPDGGGRVAVTNALPHWTASLGGVQSDQVLYNTVSLGAAALSLQGPGSPEQPFEGSYFVRFQSSFDGLTVPALAQLGTIPPATASVRFYGTGSLSVLFENQQIPIVALERTSTYTVYGADVFALAGLTGLLQFQGLGRLDNILFSNQPVPEPGVGVFFGLGALLVGWRALRRQ